MRADASRRRLARAVAGFSRRTVLVVGDVMLDRFVWGEVTRINPEAPVPVLRVRRENSAPGGAANAAANVRSLGARTFLLGYVGADEKGAELARLLRARRIRAKLVPVRRPTTTKVRALARGQQLLRLDYEVDGAPSPRDEAALCAELTSLLPSADAVIVSDYGKGVVTERVLRLLTGGAERGPVIAVDPTPAHIDMYRDATLLTPNTKEAGASLHREIRTQKDLREVGRALSVRLNAHVLVTRGEHGMSCFCRDGERFDLPTVAKEVIDVTGAGDTVIAAVTLALASNVPLRDAVALANVAAGIVVSKAGTATVSPEELRRALSAGH